jgi:hypothetical protein
LFHEKDEDGGAVALPARFRFSRRMVSLIVEAQVVEDVEVLVDPGLVRLVPPGPLVAQRDPEPALQGFIDPLQALAVVRPAEQIDQLIPAERDGPVREVVGGLGELDQPDDHVLIERGREAVLVVRGDGQPPGDHLAGPLVADPVLEGEGLAAGGDAAAQGGERELGQVQLVPSEGASRPARVVGLGLFDRFHGLPPEMGQQQQHPLLLQFISNKVIRVVTAQVV